jgi:hypothetical protein
MNIVKSINGNWFGSIMWQRSLQNGLNLLELIQATALPQVGHLTMASVIDERAPSRRYVVGQLH